VQVHIIAHIGLMVRKGRIIGQDFKGIVVYFQSVLHAFHRYAAFLVADHPVQWCRRQLIAEMDVCDIRLL